MIITPRYKLESLNFAVVTIDALLYLFLGFLIFFVGPLFLIIFLHAGRRRHSELSDAEVNLIGNLFDSKEGNISIWILFGFAFGILFSVLMVLRKLRRLHLIKVELKEDLLVMHYKSINGKETSKEIPLAPKSIKINIEKSTPERDPHIEIIHVETGNTILSTKKSKYWEYKYDFKNLLELRDRLLSERVLKE